MKKACVKSKNEQLNVEIAKMRQEFTSEQLIRYMTDPEFYKFGFYSYKRGLLQRGLDILEDEENPRIFDTSEGEHQK